MALVRIIIRVLSFILKILFMPINGLLSLLWLILPKKVKIFVGKFSEKLAGYYAKIKKYWNKWIEKRKK